MQMMKGRWGGSLLFALAVLFWAAQARAEVADCWVVCSARTGDMGFGSTTSGVAKLNGALVHRTVRWVMRTDLATGRRVVTRTYMGGVTTTRMTWAQFVALERGR